MRFFDFNDNFKGFEDREEILVDTNILLAYLNSYDAWHNTVSRLFDNHKMYITLIQATSSP